jgi:hypothetical protein
MFGMLKPVKEKVSTPSGRPSRRRRSQGKAAAFPQPTLFTSQPSIDIYPATIGGAGFAAGKSGSESEPKTPSTSKIDVDFNLYRDDIERMFAKEDKSVYEIVR